MADLPDAMTFAENDSPFSPLPIRDQGRRPACLSMALTDGHAFVRKLAEHLSADFLHYHATQACGRSHNDRYPIKCGVSALRDPGQPLEAFCPYQGQSRPLTWQPTFSEGAHPELLRWMVSTGHPFSRAQILVHLQKRIPCVIILRINQAFADCRDGIIRAVTGMEAGCHAVVLVGSWSDRKEEYWYLIRNSWGPEWGKGGYAWLAESYLFARCSNVLCYQESTRIDADTGKGETGVIPIVAL